MDTTILELEIETLRQALQESDEICRAIRHGEVDAVVVGRNDEEKQVLLMSGAYTRYRHLVDDMLQGAVTVSSSGDVLFTNKGFASMLGMAPEELDRSSLERWIAPHDWSKIRPLLVPGAPVQDAEVQLARADGKPGPRARVSLVTASDEFITVMVTELGTRLEAKDAEATLDAIRNGLVDAFVVGGTHVKLLDSAQAPYRVLVDRMRQGAVTVSADGIVVYANERFLSMIAMPHGRVLGRKLAELVAEGSQETIQGLLAGEEESMQAELKLRCANGLRPVTQATVSIMDGHRLFLFTDLTEQRRHKDADERTRKFLGMLAHEFRNILGPIGNSTQILKRTQSLDADGQKAVDTIARQTDRLLGLVEDLRRINPTE